MQIEYEHLTLGNLGGNDFQQEFVNALEALLEAMRDPDVVGANTSVAGAIDVKLALRYTPDTGAVHVSAEMVTKAPKRRTRHQSATVLSGSLMVPSEKSVAQAGLFTHPPTPNH